MQVRRLDVGAVANGRRVLTGSDGNRERPDCTIRRLRHRLHGRPSDGDRPTGGALTRQVWTPSHSTPRFDLRRPRVSALATVRNQLGTEPHLISSPTHRQLDTLYGGVLWSTSVNGLRDVATHPGHLGLVFFAPSTCQGVRPSSYAARCGRDRSCSSPGSHRDRVGEPCSEERASARTRDASTPRGSSAARAQRRRSRSVCPHGSGGVGPQAK